MPIGSKALSRNVNRKSGKRLSNVSNPNDEHGCKDKPARVKKYCPNPYGKKHAKVARNKTFVIVTKNTVVATRGRIPDLREGDYICKSCHLRIYMFIKSLPESLLPAPDEAETDQDSYVDDYTDSETTDEEFSNIAEEKKSVVALLKQMNVSSEGIQREYVSTAAATGTYDRVKARVQEIKLRLQRITGSGKDISPKKAQTVLTQRKADCQDCQKLLEALAVRFKSLSSKEDQYHVLTSVPFGTTIKTMVEKFECSIYMARKASHLRQTVGVYTAPAKKKRQGLDPSTVQKVINFYESDENSRVDPGLSRAVYVFNPETGKRELRAKRVIWMTLNELHREFQMKHPGDKISVSALSLLRPKNIVWSGRNGFHNSCTCSIHENFKLLMHLSLDVEESLTGFLEKTFCSIENESCMFGICPKCPKLDLINAYIEAVEPEKVAFHYWGSSPGCIGLQLLDAVEDVGEFNERIKLALQPFASHHFIAQKQKAFITWLKEDAVKQENAAVLQVDFAQNYSFIIQNAVAGHHWSNCQATVVPFVLIWYCKKEKEVRKKAYVVISDELGHNATTFHAFYTAVLKEIENDGLKFDKIHIVSDGAGSQFKNWKNLLNLRYHLIEFGIKALWHFFATSHGKSECDAAGATVKRACRLASLKLDSATRTQVNVRNSAEMYEFAKTKLTSASMQILHITAVMVATLLDHCKIEDRYALGDKIPGVRMYHSFHPTSATEIVARRFSSSVVEKRFMFLQSTPAAVTIYSVGEFVAVQVGERIAVGEIISEDIEDGEFQIQLLQQTAEVNTFQWPDVTNVQMFPLDKIIMKLEQPTAKKTGVGLLQVTCTEFRELKSFVMHQHMRDD